MKLNTENTNCFIYPCGSAWAGETEELLIELLGGVRIEGLDRMRVTMKVSVVNRKHPQYTHELADLAIRHNLDLYNDTQVDFFFSAACTYPKEVRRGVSEARGTPRVTRLGC